MRAPNSLIHRYSEHIKPLKIVLCALIFFANFTGHSQVMQLEVLGGAVVAQGSTITINAGSSLDFRITNVETTNCKNLRIKDVNISNTTDFDINPNNPKRNIKPAGCPGPNWKKYLDFEIVNLNLNCATTSTLVTVIIKNQADFTFTLEVNSSPEIYVLGGNPWADIYHNSTITSDANGTDFGVVDEGNVVTRTYIVANIGSCYLDITALSSSNTDFAVSSPYPIPWNNLPPYYYIVIDVTFTAPVAGTGTQTATISIDNTDNTTFNFDVSAEMFNENIPGPGGITADFRLWLKTSRGVTKTGTKVSLWEDLGTNGKDAEQPTAANQPTYLDDVTNNINFNPVIQFENDGAGTEQYLYNTTNGFYSQDIFIVMTPDATMSSASSRNTIFAGVASGNANDITGVGFGDYSTEFTNEVLSYNQDVAGGGSYNGEAELNSSYSNAGIINIRNNVAVSPTGQDILYNSTVLTTSTVSDIAFANVGSPGPPVVLGTEFWIGRNYDQQGSLNGRIAEIFTFAERVSDADRQKIESYLAIKYGITLGTANEAQKDYINSFDTVVWDISANSGYNFDVAGIGRDSISDLNQKQSKTLNTINGVTIGLGGIYTVNSANPNEFQDDGDFLVWGNNNAALSGTNTNTITIASGITTSLTRMDRKWKIVESTEVIGADLETVFVGIPDTAFSGFSKTAEEEYALIVADNPVFTDADIIDVIPLKINVDPLTGNPILDQNGNQIYKTWYDFHGTNYFTFGKVSKLADNHSIGFGSGDYLVGEYSLNLSVDSFSISAWVKCGSNPSTRTIMSKGSKLQIRLNSSDQIEVLIDDDVTPKYTSNITLGDNKWHHLTFIYDSASVFLYVDGILDHSVQDVVHPSPNYNHFCIGAVYVNKNTILNSFVGEIDEVYVWDLALTEEQIYYLMNQELERFDNAGTDYVSGKSLPYAATNNPMSAIPWSSLRVYYDFNSFYGSTIEGLTDDRFFLRLRYLNKDKTLIDDQTAPLPYVNIADGAWDDPNVWSNSADQIIPNSVGLDGVTPIDWNIVDLNYNIISGDRDIYVEALKNNTGKLTIADPNDPQDETNSGQALKVSNYLEIDGVIDLVGESQLIQTEGSVLDEDSGGYIERDQQGTANSYNYNYWSSSVGPISGNSATRGTGISSTNANHNLSTVLMDGTNSSAYQNITFSPSYTAADSGPYSPMVISSFWLYKFYGANDNYYAWASINESSSLLPGEGFTMKGTSGAADIVNDVQNYVFKGKPNNGDITVSLNKNVTVQNPSGNVDRLVGNPYPSALDATEFILDNLSIVDGGNNVNGTIFNGAIYFWDHFGQEDSHQLGDYIGGYATRNLLASAPAIANDTRINATGGSGTKLPGQYIPVNQGFFVTTSLNGFDNDNGVPIAVVDGGDVIFKNSQRVFVRESAPNSLFMRSSVTSNNRNEEQNNNSLIRLTFDSPTGLHRQIVLGTDDNASIDFDIGYDAFMADVNQEDMYWLYDQERFVIQGVDSFTDGQEFPIGLVIKEAGLARIQIEDLQNIDENTQIYIRDTASGEQFEITTEPFEVHLEPGTYNDRYTLVFMRQIQTESESEEDVTIEDDNFVVYYDSEPSELTIKSGSDTEILNVSLYNTIGQKIQLLDYSSTDTITIRVNTGVYILYIETTSGNITKKIIIN